MIADALVSARRRLSAEPPAVFRAFTEPALLERWFCPNPEVHLRVESLDVRPGGTYRFVFSFPGGNAVPVVGNYRVVEPGRRLVFTWTWEEPDEHAGLETLVTVDFLAQPEGGTEVIVTHELLPSPAKLQQHDAGWQGCLARLDQLFPKGESPQ